MGFSSWKTADTKQSIYNKYTDKCKPVYLLQPNGQPAIAEPEYDGYAVFGGVDVFVWLAIHNFPTSVTENLDDQQLRSLGLMSYFPLRSFVWEGRKHIYDFEEQIALATGVIHIGDDYVLLKEDDNDWRCSEFNKQGMTKNRLKGQLPYPLKFSFNPNCLYENHSASELCPHQGFFE